MESSGAFWSHLKLSGLIWRFSGGHVAICFRSVWIWFNSILLGALDSMWFDVCWCCIYLILFDVSAFHGVGLMLCVSIHCHLVVFDLIWGGLSWFNLILVDPIQFALVCFHLSWFGFKLVRSNVCWFTLSWSGLFRCYSIWFHSCLFSWMRFDVFCCGWVHLVGVTCLGGWLLSGSWPDLVLMFYVWN